MNTGSGIVAAKEVLPMPESAYRIIFSPVPDPSQSSIVNFDLGAVGNGLLAMIVSPDNFNGLQNMDSSR